MRHLSPAEWAVLGLAVAWALLCIGPGHTLLMHLVHPVWAAALGAWGAIAGIRLLRTSRLQRALNAVSRPAVLGGVAYRVIVGSTVGACSVGVLRPQIYIGERALAGLDRDERTAVLLHEEHHRRTVAPLRALAVEAWLALLRRVPVIGRQLMKRLADLEANADRFALERGASPVTIARALVKMPAGPSATAFSRLGEHRVRSLHAAATGGAIPSSALAMEWMPIAAAVYALATCALVALGRGL